MEVVHDRSLVQVRQLSHVVRLVELCWVDFVNALSVDFPLLFQVSIYELPRDMLTDTHAPIVTLDQEPAPLKLLHHPPLDKRRLRVPKPDILFA